MFSFKGLVQMRVVAGNRVLFLFIKLVVVVIIVVTATSIACIFFKYFTLKSGSERLLQPIRI